MPKGKKLLLLLAFYRRYRPLLTDYRRCWAFLCYIYRFVHKHKLKGIKQLFYRLKEKLETTFAEDLSEWFLHYRPTPMLLERFRKQYVGQNREELPLFSILMCVYNTNELWLKEAINSALNQVYPHFELICVNDASTKPSIKPLLDHYALEDMRVKVLHLTENQGVSRASNEGLKLAKGEVVCFMDHDDVLEPQALHRFFHAYKEEKPDILYSDEAVVAENIDHVLSLRLHPAFSYDYYLSHPYFIHLIGIKRTLLAEIGGFDASLKVSQDYDLVLRSIEKAKRITHVPDILYRWRTHPGSLGHQVVDKVLASSLYALNNHMQRLGFPPGATAGRAFNFFNHVFEEKQTAKVAIIIPTKDKGSLLKQCIDSITRTEDASLFDLYVIDHDSSEWDTKRYLEEIKASHQVIPYTGSFNFSAIMNKGVAAASLRYPYSHYLLLNNDVEALEPGWLDSMLKVAQRSDVGVVGAVLLYPDKIHIQHVGVIVGLYGKAEHWHKGQRLRTGDYYHHGYNGSLLAVRDYSAVTAACMLVKAELYQQVGGFDEQLQVGYGDVDFCLKVREKGYKVLVDTHAAFVHHESMTRGKSWFEDTHPEDTALFKARYHAMITLGDPFYHPLLDRESVHSALKTGITCDELIVCRTSSVCLPKKQAQQGEK